MTYTTTAAYRLLVARAIMGDAVDLLPAKFALGTGRYDPVTGVLTPPSPADTGLEAPLAMTPVTVNVSRSGQTILVTAVVEGDATPVEITEAAVFLDDDTMVLIDAFRPRTLVEGVPFAFAYTLLPEVN